MMTDLTPSPLTLSLSKGPCREHGLLRPFRTGFDKLSLGATEALPA